MSNSTPPLCPGFTLGEYHLDLPLALAPMAGITDLPFRHICKRFGAALMVTEMIASRAVDAGRARTGKMAEIDADEHPIAIQIAGSDPVYMREAAQWAQAHQADFVDINMGCPVKKICKQTAGSALLKDERQVARILDTVVKSVKIPVTLKTRTDWDQQSRPVSIPVLGNGDVVDGESTREIVRISDCDGVMIGRAVQGVRSACGSLG